MAGYSARQSSFTTGDTITAAHSNDEFNQVLAAFNATTGHTHDGTAGEGGPVGSIRDAAGLNKILDTQVKFGKAIDGFMANNNTKGINDALQFIINQIVDQLRVRE